MSVLRGSTPWTAELLRLYPRRWRARHEAEMRDMLDGLPATAAVAADLLRGALDAHLHGDKPSRVPAFASLSGGALWIVAALTLAIQPVPADWPGYILEILPLALAATTCLLVAVAGMWLRLGDGVRGFETLAIDVALVGQGAWILALIGVVAHVDYAASILTAMSAALIGLVLVALALVGAGDRLVAGLLLLASSAMGLAAVVPIPVAAAWLAFGITWTGIGFVALADWAAATPSARDLAGDV